MICELKFLLRRTVLTTYASTAAGLEIERKTFHAAGVLVPLGYQALTSTFNVPEQTCVTIALTGCAMVWVVEIARLKIPFIQVGGVKCLHCTYPYYRGMHSHC